MHDLTKIHNKYTNKLLEIINEYKNKENELEKIILRFNLPEKTDGVFRQFISECKCVFPERNNEIGYVLFLTKALKKQGFNDENSLMVFFLNRELIALLKKKKQKEDCERKKEEKLIEERKLVNEKAEKHQMYNSMIIEELIALSITNHLDKNIINGIIINKKNNLIIESMRRELNDFKHFCQQESIENLKKLINDEDTEDNQKIIIRVELRSRYKDKASPMRKNMLTLENKKMNIFESTKNFTKSNLIFTNSINMDGSKDYYGCRDHGQFGSYPLCDNYDDESEP